MTEQRINLSNQVKSVRSQFAGFLLSAMLLSVFGVGVTQAQEVIIASGGNAETNSGSVSYSVGQVVYSNFSGANGRIDEGVQLPYEISAITGVEVSNKMNLMLLAYPNPATDHLTLKIDASSHPSIQSMEYRLYNVDGKLLDTQKIEAYETNIPMNNVVTGSYFLKVMKGNEAFKTFKIIKK